MEALKFYRCMKCGNLIQSIEATACTPTCCGETRTELVPNTIDGAAEKHVPEVSQVGNLVTVTVGSVEHPMLEAHYIQWIYLETTGGYYRKELHPGDKPVATFNIQDEKVVAAYDYCNLHGLWKA